MRKPVENMLSRVFGAVNYSKEKLKLIFRALRSGGQKLLVEHQQEGIALELSGIGKTPKNLSLADNGRVLLRVPVINHLEFLRLYKVTAFIPFKALKTNAEISKKSSGLAKDFYALKLWWECSDKFNSNAEGSLGPGSKMVDALRTTILHTQTKAPEPQNSDLYCARIKPAAARSLDLFIYDKRSPDILVFADSIRVQGSATLIAGRITSIIGNFHGADLVWRSNATAEEFIGKCELKFLSSWTEMDCGRLSYRFFGRVEFSADRWPQLLTSDYFDAYIRTYDAEGQKIADFRITRVPILARKFCVESYGKNADEIVSIAPYFTYGANFLSAWVQKYSQSVEPLLSPRNKELKKVEKEYIANSAPVWLIGELPYKAQDNGMHFYNWMRDMHPEIEAFYVLNRDSKDKRNLKDQSHIVDVGSKKHFELALRAQRFIGTHNAEYLYPTRLKSFTKKLTGKCVFLQHGVMGTKWMTPLYGKNSNSFKTDLFLVSSSYEKQYIVRDFGYADNEVCITGLSRFDQLFAHQTDIKMATILIIPTWREWLTGVQDLTESEYFQRWYGLLADPEFNTFMSVHGLNTVLCLHPNMQQFSHQFSKLPVKVVFQGEENVQDLIMQSTVMVTDYSSVGFDFSFLRKPVVYYQFDSVQFFGSAGSHIDPANELPGDIVETREEILKTLYEYADRDFQPSDRAMQNAQKFIDYSDTNNSERVYKTIESL